jgi:hypothetical protein
VTSAHALRVLSPFLDDPAAGAGTPLGTLGDLTKWSGSITLGPTSGALRAYSSAAQGARLLSFDPQTGASAEVAVGGR